jgi:hypothetical protein
MHETAKNAKIAKETRQAFRIASRSWRPRRFNLMINKKPLANYR